MGIVLLKETKMESCSKEIDGWQFFHLGHQENSRLNGSIGFLVKIDMEAEWTCLIL